jgi:tRNA-dihydrouridine synthase
MNVWEDLRQPFFVLAPMDDVTDTVFRQIVGSCAPPDLFFTEFVNADGLQSPGRNKLLKKLKFNDKERPIVAQIWGKVPENYYKTARELADLGFSGIDINMGCPVRAVVKNGCCSALIDNRELAASIIDATKRGASSGRRRLPVSAKTRLGNNSIDLSWPEFLLRQGIDALTIHGRTVRNMSDVPANWHAIARIRELRDRISPGTKIIGNGDVRNRRQGLALAEKHGLDGVMIGRGVFQDPFVFAGLSPWSEYTKTQKAELFRRHVELFAATWQNGERNTRALNKFCKVYINGFDGAKELRESLMKAKKLQELRILTASIG